MYQELKDKYHIISFDSLGHGLSTYEKETPQSTQEWVDYFVNSVKAFADKLKLEKFNIMGHSLGGFIMAHFANKHPEMVQEIFLLSPGGVNRENKNYEKRIENRFENANWFMKKAANSMLNKIFVEKQSPMDHCMAKLFRGTIVKRFYGDRLGLSKDDQKLFGKLFSIFSSYKPSSEKCLGYLFNKGPMSNRPIMPILKKFHKKKNIIIMFGSSDWMDYKLTTKIINEDDLDICVETVQNAGHQLIFQNPKSVCQYINYHMHMNQLEGEEEENKSK
jgi:predicted alpha/beta superfamily hydrolase